MYRLDIPSPCTRTTGKRSTALYALETRACIGSPRTLTRWLRNGIGSAARLKHPRRRSEEHTSELQSLMRISYAVFCLKKKTPNSHHTDKNYRPNNNTDKHTSTRAHNKHTDNTYTHK